MSLLLAASGDIASGVVEPEGVDFDGVNDYLSRSSDLTGNVDSKTFTFSCWVYLGKKYTSGAPNLLYNYGGSAGSVEIDILGSSPKGIRILGYNSAGTLILDGRSSLVHESFINTWANVLISIDMSSTTKRHIFLNDIDITNTVTWATFINDTLDFTSTTWRVANGLQCRMEELFRDYTYRDLSIEANRRLFITADGKPAEGLDYVDKYLDNKFYVGGQESNPNGMFITPDGTKMFICGITADAVFSYTLTTQYNITSAVYDSKTYNPVEMTNVNSIAFSSSGAYMYLLGGTTVYQYILSVPYDITTASYLSKSFLILGSETYGIFITNDGKYMYASQNGGLVVRFSLSTYNDITTCVQDNYIYIANSEVLRSCWLSQDGMHLIAASAAPVYGIYSYSLSTPYDLTTALASGEKIGISQYPISISCSDTKLYICSSVDDTIYQYTLSTPYDISTAVYGLPANAPAAPILYLPMKDASTCHINEGTGGNFVQNGTLDTASRGANQDNCVASYFDGSADYLSRTSLTVVADGKQFTLSFNFSMVSLGSTSRILIDWSDLTPNLKFRVIIQTNGILEFQARNLSNTAILFAQSINTFIVNKNYFVNISLDLSDTSKKHFIINGVSASINWLTYTNDNIDFTTERYRICASNASTPNGYFNGNIGELYFDTRYIDLSVNNPFWEED